MIPLEYGVHAMSAAGVPITVAMLRSLQVLLGHLVWLFAGVAILGNVLKPFFGSRRVRYMQSHAEHLLHCCCCVVHKHKLCTEEHKHKHKLCTVSLSAIMREHSACTHC
jgi:hypothetical protein